MPFRSKAALRGHGEYRSGLSTWKFSSARCSTETTAGARPAEASKRAARRGRRNGKHREEEIAQRRRRRRPRNRGERAFPLPGANVVLNFDRKTALDFRGGGGGWSVRLERLPDRLCSNKFTCQTLREPAVSSFARPHHFSTRLACLRSRAGARLVKANGWKSDAVRGEGGNRRIRWSTGCSHDALVKRGFKRTSARF